LRTRFGRLASRRSPDGKALWLNWALRLQDNAVYVGSLQATVSADAMAYIAYFVFTPWQRRGFARESCAALIDFLAARGVDRFAAEMDTRNRASIALVESLGFVRVAETAGADSFKGAASDEFRYERPIS